MIVERVEVRNFRAVRNASIDLQPLTYLVGRNGAGKSTILGALGLFFGRLRAAWTDCSGGNTEEPIEISVTFVQLGPAAEEFAKYVQDGRLRVTKRITFANDIATESYYGRSLTHPAFSDVRRLTPAAKLTAYREQIRDPFGLPTCRSASEVDAALEGWEHDHPDQLQLMEDDGRFFGYRNVAMGKLDKYLDFVLVPAVRDAAADASEGKDSTLKLLIDAVVRRAANVNTPISELRDRVVRDYAELLRRPEMSLSRVQEQVTSAMQRFAPGAEVAFEWGRLEDARLPEPTVVARLIDDGVEGGVSSKGHGLQRAYIMATLQALAEAEARVEDEVDAQERGKGLVLAVEEPELYQHPAQARRIAATFMELTAGAGIQVIACTHSPLFLSVQAFDRIRLVRKPPMDGVPQTSISRVTLDEVAGRLSEVHDDGRGRTGRGLQPALIGLLNPYINEAFFADFVVLVEGEEDKALLDAVLKEKWADPELERRAIAVVPVGGKKNLDKMYVILSALGIPVYVVFDRDGENRESQVQVETWNRLLQRMVGVPDPTGMPATIAERGYAIFSPKLTDVVKSELGADLWLRIRQEACERLTLDVRTGVEKNPVVVHEMLRLAQEEGAHAESLEAAVEAICRSIRLHFADGA